MGNYYSFGKADIVYKLKKKPKISFQVEFQGNDVEICYEDNSYYRGEMKNFLRNGKGLLIFANGQRYIGEFKKNKMNGKGTLFSDKGELIWEGEFKDDRLDIPEII